MPLCPLPPAVMPRCGSLARSRPRHSSTVRPHPDPRLCTGTVDGLVDTPTPEPYGRCNEVPSNGAEATLHGEGNATEATGLGISHVRAAS